MTVITARAARASGRSYAVRTGLANGTLVEVLPSIYAARGVEWHSKVRLAAASAWSYPNGAISGLAAARVWGLVDTPPRRITVAFPKPLHRTRPEWLRTKRLTEDLQIVVVNGIRVVDIENTVVQAWNEAEASDRIAIVVDAIRFKRTTVARLRAIAVGRVRIRQRKRLLRLLELLAGGITSYLEYIARTTVFTAKRFPYLVWQRPAVASGRERSIDIYDPEAELGIELDSREFHGSDEARRADLERSNQLSMIGTHLLHFTFEDITRRPQWCVEVYEATRRTRLAQLRGPSGGFA
jgi:hypothetical protein